VHVGKTKPGRGGGGYTSALAIEFETPKDALFAQVKKKDFFFF
jgi:hypothetical protein